MDSIGELLLLGVDLRVTFLKMGRPWQNSPIAWGQNIVYSNGKTFPVQRPPSAVGKVTLLLTTNLREFIL